MFEQPALERKNKKPAPIDGWSDKRLSVLYHELQQELSDAGYESLNDFKAHISMAVNPNSILSECQIIANRR